MAVPTNDTLWQLRSYARPYYRSGSTDLKARPVVGDPWRSEPGDPHGPLVAGDGYWIVDDGTYEWPVEKSAFEQTYLNSAPTQPTDWRHVERFVWTSLVKMDREFHVKTKESDGGPQQGRVGDYLAFGALGEMWVIRSEVVDQQRLYEEIVPEPDIGRPRVFISYAREDAAAEGGAAMTALCTSLTGSDKTAKDRPQCEVLLDTQNLRGGEKWTPALTRFIATSDLVIVLVGQHWCKKTLRDRIGVAYEFELPLAVLNEQSGGVIYPVLLDVDLSALYDRESRPRTVEVLGNREYSLMDLKVEKLTPLIESSPRRLNPVDVGDVVEQIAERAAEARDKRRSIGRPDFDTIFGPIQVDATPPPLETETASSTDDETKSFALPEPHVDPTFQGPFVEGPWVALSSDQDPVIVMVDATTLVGFRDAKGAPLNVDVKAPIDAVVAADDGTALMVRAGGLLHVVEAGSQPRVWKAPSGQAVAVELPTPSSRPLAMMRCGRTYEVDLADEEHRYALVIDSGGSGRGRQSIAAGSASAGAVVDGQIVSISGGRGPKAPNLTRGLNRVGLRNWLSIDASTVPHGKATVSVVAALGRRKTGDMVLAVQVGDEVRAMSVDASATAVAVTRGGALGDIQVILQLDDELVGWRVDEMPLLA